MATRDEKVQIVVGAKDKTRGILSGIQGQIISIGAAYAGWRIAKEVIGESIRSNMRYEATLVSLKAVVAVTGRDINKVYSEMETHLGGLASKAQVAEGFLKGMTTELTVEQISNMTRAVKDASIAMGEDFGMQLPLIIKAIKQLNPAILDNIGVTVRLDQVNKKIREGYYGLSKEINEATQQNAIYQEIMKQTAKYEGQEAQLLKTSEGAVKALKAAYANLQLQIGETFAGLVQDTLPLLLGLVAGISKFVETLGAQFTALKTLVNAFTMAVSVNFANLAVIIRDFSLAFDLMMSGQFTAAAAMVGKGVDSVLKSIEGMTQGLDAVWSATVSGMTVTWDSFLQAVRAGIDEAQRVSDLLEQEILPRQVEARMTMAEQLNLIDEKRNADELALLNKSAAKHKLIVTKSVAHDNTLQRELTAEFAKEEQKRLQAVQKFRNSANQLIGSFAYNMVHVMGQGRLDIKKIFTAMAADFMKFFIQQALGSLINSFIPGLGSILGSIFDTPANDRMAMRQGMHWAGYFTRGALSAIERGFAGGLVSALDQSVGARGIGHMQPGHIRTMAQSAGPVINVNINGGTFMNDDWIKDTLIREIENSVAGGSSRLQVQEDNITGQGTLSLGMA